MIPIAEFKDVSFAYKSKAGPVEALRSVSFQLSEGSIYGFLGPNGAGKTTLIRCATGLILPGKGSVEVSGKIPNRKNLRDIGVLIENPGVYRKLTAEEYLSFFGKLYGIEKAAKRILQLSEALEIDLSSKPLGKLSMGQRQKIQLLRSLLHFPKLILWDEPFGNLDPLSQSRFHEYLREYVIANKAAAIVATHQLNQAEEFCTCFGFLNNGRLIYSGTKDEIYRRTSALARIAIEFMQEIETEKLFPLASRFDVVIEYAKNHNEEVFSGSIRKEGRAKRIFLSGSELKEKVPEIITALHGIKIKICSVVPEKKSLYNIYQELVSG